MEEEEGQRGIRVGGLGGHTQHSWVSGAILAPGAIQWGRSLLPFAMYCREGLTLISMLTSLGSRTFHSQKSTNTKSKCIFKHWPGPRTAGTQPISNSWATGLIWESSRLCFLDPVLLPPSSGKLDLPTSTLECPFTTGKGGRVGFLEGRR